MLTVDSSSAAALIDLLSSSHVCFGCCFEGGGWRGGVTGRLVCRLAHREPPAYTPPRHVRHEGPWHQKKGSPDVKSGLLFHKGVAQRHAPSGCTVTCATSLYIQTLDSLNHLLSKKKSPQPSRLRQKLPQAPPSSFSPRRPKGHIAQAHLFWWAWSSLEPQAFYAVFA